MKSKLVLFFTIIVCFLLQSTVLHSVSIGSITPNLLLILCSSMGLMRGRKKRNVDRIFLRSSDRSVFWLYSWILCADLYVCGIYQRIYLSYYYDNDLKVPSFWLQPWISFIIWLSTDSSFF